MTATKTAPKKATKAAAKPSTNGKVQRTPRKESYDKKRIASVVDRLKDLTSSVAGLSKEMTDAKIDKVDVDGHEMMVRGINQIENFVNNCSSAIRRSNSKAATL